MAINIINLFNIVNFAFCNIIIDNYFTFNNVDNTIDQE